MIRLAPATLAPKTAARGPDRTHSEDGDRVVLTWPHVVEDGAGSGLDPTAERAEDGQVNVVGHLNNVVFVGDGVGGKTDCPK